MSARSYITGVCFLFFPLRVFQWCVLGLSIIGAIITCFYSLVQVSGAATQKGVCGNLLIIKHLTFGKNSA